MKLSIFALFCGFASLNAGVALAKPTDKNPDLCPPAAVYSDGHAHITFEPSCIAGKPLPSEHTIKVIKDVENHGDLGEGTVLNCAGIRCATKSPKYLLDRSRPGYRDYERNYRYEVTSFFDADEFRYRIHVFSPSNEDPEGHRMRDATLKRRHSLEEWNIKANTPATPDVGSSSYTCRFDSVHKLTVLDRYLQEHTIWGSDPVFPMRISDLRKNVPSKEFKLFVDNGTVVQLDKMNAVYKSQYDKFKGYTYEPSKYENKYDEINLTSPPIVFGSCNLGYGAEKFESYEHVQFTTPFISGKKIEGLYYRSWRGYEEDERVHTLYGVTLSSDLGKDTYHFTCQKDDVTVRLELADKPISDFNCDQRMVLFKESMPMDCSDSQAVQAEISNLIEYAKNQDEMIQRAAWNSFFTSSFSDVASRIVRRRDRVSACLSENAKEDLRSNLSSYLKSIRQHERMLR